MAPSFFKVSVKRFLTLMLVYSLTRVLFMVWNWPMFAADSAGDLFYAFILGLRFDTSALLFTNALSFLVWMFPTRWFAKKWVRTVDLAFFGVINLICIGSNFADAEFIQFTGKRSSYDLLFIRGDVERQSLNLLFSYWYLAMALALTIAVMLWVLPRFPKNPQPESWLSGGLWRFAAVGLIFTGMRGGYGYKPINPMQAYFNTHQELGFLTLNTPINVIKTTPNGKIERARYFNTDREAILRLKKMTDLSRPPLAVSPNWNVVVIILESFASEFTGAANNYPGYTPFFDSLAKKSFFFKYNFANARRSIEGLPAVLCGIPAIMEEPIITSDFSSNRLDCMPKILAKKGYSTFFLHGAHNGSMHFDSFSRIAGFEHFVGLDEYPKGNPEDFDQYWGVLDEPMLQYAVKTIDEAPKPVFLGLFTLSSHQPYFIPPKYKDKFPKGTLEIHESIGYTDYSLEQFFKVAETKPWFKNTIFVLTADHIQKQEHKEYMDLIGGFRVPLLIYVPGIDPGKVKVDLGRITQQIDVPPSVMDLLGVEIPDRLLVGQSVFDLAKEGHAYNYISRSYWYLDSKNMIELGRPPFPNMAYVHKNTWNIQERPSTEAEFQEGFLNIKAVVHYMNEGLIQNSLYRWKESL